MTPYYKNMVFNNKLELLSPAGSMDSLIAAIKNGADAVYVGGTLYNARRNAKNFTDNELVAAFDYCHSYGVRVFVTMNTMLFDRELTSALKYAQWLYESGVDALIVQDIGLVSMLRRELPELELHASTQMAIHNEAGLITCHNMGLKRAVLSREVSIDALRQLTASNTDIELEVFAHGALCMSFSGLCLYSSMSGERSGNRGMCAQPCRKHAAINAIPTTNDYCLSPADLNMLEHVADLKDAGATCIKLEGRMKRPEYVALVTRAYRHAIDGETVPSALSSDLRDIFNRGFSTGYYYCDSIKTDARANDAPDSKLIARVHESYSDYIRKMPIDMSVYAHVGKQLKLVASSKSNSITLYSDSPLSVAQKPPSSDIFMRQLSKLSDTPFTLNKLDLDFDGKAFVSVGMLNALRRDAAAQLTAKSVVRRTCASMKTPAFSKSSSSEEIQLIARIRNLPQAQAATANGAKKLIFDPPKLISSDISAITALNIPVLISLPPVLLNSVDIQAYSQAISMFSGVEINNIGQLNLLKDATEIIGGTSLNIANCESVDFLKKLHVLPTLSHELTKAQMRDILLKSPCAINVYGRTALMHLLHCPIKERKGCQNCNDFCGVITDEDKRQFPLIVTKLYTGCLVRMLNCVPTSIFDLAKDLHAAAWTLTFTNETPEETAKVIKAAKLALDGISIAPTGEFTRGHLNRAVL